MNLSLNVANRTRSRTAVVMTLCGLVATLAMAASAQGQGITVNTVNEPGSESGFTLSFPDLGISTSSKVVNTNISIEIDEQAGTASFRKYSQLVEPLMLPSPAQDGSMISTGDITINIKTSNGTFDSATQKFTTNDLFVITFTNDLSAFGLTSPTELPAVSTGTVSSTVSNAQRIDMVWQGSGQLGDPSQPLRFNYVSKNFTIIDPFPVVSAFQSLLAGICGTGTAGMVSFMFFGLWLMKTGARRRRRS